MIWVKREDVRERGAYVSHKVSSTRPRPAVVPWQKASEQQKGRADYSTLKTQGSLILGVTQQPEIARNPHPKGMCKLILDHMFYCNNPV